MPTRSTTPAHTRSPAVKQLSATAERLATLRPSEQRFVDNEILTIVGLFLLFGIVTMAGLVATADVASYAAVAAGFFVVMAATFIAAVFRIVPYWTAAVVTSVGAVTSVWMSPVDIEGSIFALPAQWLYLACALCALLIRSRGAWIAILVTVVAAFVSMIGIAAGTLTTVVVVAIVSIAVDAGAAGMGNLFAARAWRRSAKRRDVAHAQALEATADALAAQVRRDVLFRQRTAIHDTVLNTFTALLVAPDSIGRQQAAVAAANDLERLNTLDVTSADVVDVRQFRARVTQAANRVGLSASVALQFDEDVPRPPEQVLRGMLSCVTAALLNVSQHARVTAVQVNIVESVDGLTVTVSDGGVGYVPGPAGPMSVLSRAKHFGFTSNIVSSPGEGTTVSVFWPSSAAARIVRQDKSHTELMNESIAAMTRRVIAWVGGATVFQALLDQSSGLLVDWQLLSVVLAGVLVTVMLVRSSPFPVPKWLGYAAIVPVLATNAVTFSSVDDVTGCIAGGSTFIYSTAAFLTVVTVVLLSGSRLMTGCVFAAFLVANGFVVAIMLTYPGDCGDLSAANFVTSCSTVVILLVLRRNVSRFVGVLVDSDAVTVSAMAAEVDASAQAVSLVASSRELLTVSKVLLTGFADGSMDFRDPVVMDRMRSQVRLLRDWVDVTKA